MKNKILSISFFLIIFGIFICGIFIKDNNISMTERRKLTKMPKLKYNNIMNGSFMDNFENYLLDQFPFRDDFRKIKANVQLSLFRKKDNNNIFVKDNYIFKIEYPLKEKSVNSFVNKMNNLYENYLKGMNVYYTIIPDKNYYLNDDYLKLDYEELFNIVNNGLKNMKYIDVTKELSLEDYYLTDTHFKQDKIGKVVDKIALNMDFSVNKNYKKNTYYPFYGVYYGQAALGGIADELVYLTNDVIDSATVNDYESNLNTIYETSSLGAMDSYDVFLSGATPFIEITNNKSKTDKELVIFRDSFGSTIAPLLLDGYSKITLIDLRYMPSSMLNNYIEFKNQDVLIMYNTLVINNSDTIRN